MQIQALRLSEPFWTKTVPLLASAFAALALAIIFKMQEREEPPKALVREGPNYRKKGDFLRELNAIIASRQPIEERGNRLMLCLMKKREDLESAMRCNPGVEKKCFPKDLVDSRLRPNYFDDHVFNKNHVGWTRTTTRNGTQMVAVDQKLLQLFNRNVTLSLALELQEKYTKICSNMILCLCDKCSEKEEHLQHLYSWGKTLHNVHLYVADPEKYKHSLSWSLSYAAKVLEKVETRYKAVKDRPCDGLDGTKLLKKMNEKLKKLFTNAFWLVQERSKAQDDLVPRRAENEYTPLSELAGWMSSWKPVFERSLFPCKLSCEVIDPKDTLLLQIAVCKAGYEALTTEESLPPVGKHVEGAVVEKEGYVYSAHVEKEGTGHTIKFWKVERKGAIL